MSIKYQISQIMLFFCLASCTETLKRADEDLTEKDVAVEIGQDVEILYSDSAVVRVRVSASVLHNITLRAAPRQEFPKGVKVEFFGANRQLTSTLTAKNAIRNMEKAFITAQDSVVLQTVKQEKLETASLIWDEKTETVHTDKFVKITKPGEVIYGYGLEANQDFSYWKILIPKGKIKVEY